MNATIVSPQSRSSASVVERCDREDQAATQIRRSRAIQWALTIVCSALIATFLTLGAVRTIVIVADAVQCVVSTHESMLQNGEPEDRQLP